MAEFCAENERIKHAYFAFLREAKGRDQATIDGVAKALARYEEDTGYRPFTRYHREQAIAFKRRLAEQVNQRHGDPLSRSTMLSTLNALKAFFLWLVEQKGRRVTFVRSDAEYFSLPANDVRIAKADRGRPVPTLEQVQSVILGMPSTTDIEKRDQAVVAFTLLTGARDSATISFRLKHVDLAAHRVEQDARDVKTKFRKTFTTTFFPVGDDIRAIVERWVTHLTGGLGFGPNDPLFPATRNLFEGQSGELRPALDRRPWTQTDAVRRIFKAAFAHAGLPYSNPHTIRKTLVQLAYRLKLSWDEMVAWSQNLGHERMLTTFLSYGEVSSERRSEVIRALAERRDPGNDYAAIGRSVVEMLQQQQQLPAPGPVKDGSIR